MAKKIVVTIDKQGGTSIDMEGFKGKDCLKETLELEEALGKKTDKRKMKTDKALTVGDKTKVGA